MKLSIIVPAYNEERLISGCLASIRAAAHANQRADFQWEIVVVDNNSTDRTAEIAREAGAVVGFEPERQISRARNSGAALATGDWSLFVDADSYPSGELLGDTLGLIEDGRFVGCGATVQMENISRWMQLWLATWNMISVLRNWAAGSFILSRSIAFREIGGFSEEFFAAEEIDFSRRLRDWGKRHRQKFTILRKHPLTTSNRKTRLYTPFEITCQLARVILRPWRSVRDRKYLDLWYDGRR